MQAFRDGAITHAEQLAQLKLDLPIEPKPATQHKGARFSLRARWTSTT